LREKLLQMEKEVATVLKQKSTEDDVGALSDETGRSSGSRSCSRSDSSSYKHTHKRSTLSRSKNHNADITLESDDSI